MRAVITTLSWPIAVLTTAGVAIRMLGLERGTLLVQAMSFYPYVIVAAVVLAGMLWLGDRRFPAALAAMALLVGGVPLAARALPLVTYDDLSGDDILTVATLNLQYGAADADQVVALARRVDLLALQEVTDEAIDRLRAAGLEDELPHRVVDPRSGAAGSGTWSRHELIELPPLPGTFAMPRVRMAHPTRADLHVGVTNVHVVPPVSGAVDTWATELAGLAAGDLGWILLGDFNATLDHGALRRVLASGYTDAAAAVGQGWRATWPASGSRLPGIAIDHVLTGGNGGASAVEVIGVDGTDHRAVVARLVFPLRY